MDDSELQSLNARENWNRVAGVLPIKPVRQPAGYHGPWINESKDDAWYRKARLFWVPYIISAQLASNRPLSWPQFLEGVLGVIVHVGVWIAANVIDIVLLSEYFTGEGTTLRFLQVLALVTVLIATAVVFAVILMHLCMGNWNEGRPGLKDGMLAAVVSGTITGFARLSSYFAMFQLAFILFQPTAEVQAANVVADNVRNLVAAQVVLKHFGVTLMLHNHRFKAHDDATDYVAAH